MIYGSVCSGIGAPELAWHGLGWRASFLSEIEKFPRAVLKHHWPEVPLHGDFTTIEDDYESIDLLVGGTPCQSFSVAGLRGGLDDDRGNLALEYLKLAQRLRPKWLVWENVPGVLSSNEGRDFGSILGGMVEIGYHVAYRILDAQFFGIPQRRRRVFIVGHLGDWRCAAAVLFERHSLSGNPPPRREAGERIASTLGGSSQSGGFRTTDPDNSGAFIPEVSPALKSRDYKGPSSDGDGDGAPLIVHALTQRYDSSEDGSGRGTPLVTSFKANAGNEFPAPDDDGSVCQTLQSENPMAVAFTQEQKGGVREADYSAPILSHAQSDSSTTQYGVRQGMSVRRLTPRECERLQGFPDDYSLIPYRNGMAKDGPRYKALGNAMAVPVMKWIGERIQMVTEQ